MRRPIALPTTALLAVVLIGAASPAWHFNFNQGVAEYAVGDFGAGRDHLALYCAEAGVKPGSVSLSLARAGFSPAPNTPATFATDRGEVTLFVDREGSISYPSLAVAPRFRTLWRLLATAERLEVRYGPGAPLRFPLAGAAELLGSAPCPKQLAS